MLTLLGPRASRRHCDGISRRDMLRIGAIGLGGLTLPQLLALESSEAASNAGGKRHKSLIMIYCCGGPPHQDMYEIKNDAPVEVRGEFKAIPTAVPGIEICELLPNLARIMDKLVPIRTVVGCKDDHAGYQCYTGHLSQNAPAGGWPHIGSSSSRLQGPVLPGVPPFVSLCYVTQHKPYNEPSAGFLGLGHNAFRPMGEGKDDLVLQGITADRLGDRQALLSSVDRFRREWDGSRTMDGLDTFTQRAMGILTSSEFFAAMDVSKEDQKTRDRYGFYDPKRPKGDGAPRVPQNLLLARRLIEAGVRVVTINYSFWDWHGQNFKNAKEELPIFDKAVSALVEDLHERGMADDCTVIAWGEFGRTPKINKDAGRDHWPRVSCALMAGGGMKTGQAIGTTTRDGGEPAERPVTFEEVHATLYRNLGINLNSAPRLFDFRGRPQYLVDPSVKPIRELI
ncbi:MAG TPA: DUF1501 domain-containing protein [Pirellulaceae bacterium]|nr:DUF1501 domain-containing protein [Pirellulaceae bacterium]